MSHSDNDDLIRAVSPWLATSECMQVRNLGWEIIEATIRSQVRKIIDHQINSPADRDDCYQEVTITLWQQLPRRITDPNIRSISNRIMGVARHKVLDQFRRRKKTLSLDSIDEQVLHSKAGLLSAVCGEPLETQEQAQSILQFLRRRISATQLEVFLLQTQQGLTAVEIATRINRTPKQVHKIIHRVRSNVQNYFPKKNVPDDSRDIRSHHGGFLRPVIERNTSAHFGSLTDPVRGDVCRFRR